MANGMTCPWYKTRLTPKAADLYTCGRLSTMRVTLEGDQRMATIEISADAGHPKGDSRPV